MITCHLCGSTETSPFTEKNGHSIYRCRSCDLIFVDPITVGSEEIYSKDYFEGASRGFGYVDYDQDKEPMRPVFGKYLKIIEKSLGKKGGKLLDVGAATGYFVEMAAQAGFDAEGVDISEHAARIGLERGRKVRAGEIGHVEGVFDCITMLDLIEHVPNPREVIKKASALLQSGGILVVNAPDAGSFLARMLGRRWHLISPPEHLHYFNRANFNTLLEQEGFKTVRITTIGKSFTPTYICKVLGRSTHIGLFDMLSGFFAKKIFKRISVPVNLHDNMFVVARKK